MNSTLPRLFALLAACAALTAHGYNHTLVATPLPLGPLNVACSNIEQDTSKLAPGAAPSDYWEGFPVNGTDHYIDEILAHPGAPFQYAAPVPDQSSLYPGHAGQNVTFVALVCYPTPAANTDPNYTLPGGSGNVVPHMALPGAAPNLVSAFEYQVRMTGGHTDPPINSPQQLPVIVFSHGLTGSPIDDGYIQAIVALASQGFMVAAPFHGDPRFSRVRIDTISDVAFLITQFDRVAEMELMRPLSLKFMLDKLLADPGYAPGIDVDRIGGFGASLGGEAMATLTGARLSTSINLDCNDSIHDPRVKAVVGYVPFAGYSFLPAFCAGQSGAKGVNRPYLAISGTLDTTAPMGMSSEAVDQFQSSRFIVEFVDGKHELRPQDASTLMYWTVTFLDAYLGVGADPTAMGRFIQMDEVAGGGRENHMILDVHVPLANSDGDVNVLEFYNTTLGHYFMAAGAGEIAGIQAGAAGPGWELTGESFKAWLTMPAPQFAAVPVCRFYGAPAGGPNSHFFTAEADECAQVKANGGWFYEGTGFYIQPVDASGNCPLGYLAVERAYNNGFPRNDSNHRFSTSDSTMRSMASQGWAVEGNVMCARP
jgi:predicted dienelactone hydrolase